MAKQIKAIECPKCGSTDKTEIKPDYFVCNNCGTEYFLDNDDITVNHNIKYQGDKPATPFIFDKKKLRFVMIGLAIFFLLMSIIPRLFTKQSSRDSVRQLNSNDPIKREETRWYSSSNSFFINSKGDPVLIIAGTRRHDHKDNDAAIAFIDLQSGKEIKLHEITSAKAEDRPEYNIQRFSNGDIFIIENKMKIYKVDKNNYSFTDVTASLLASQPKMSTGIANVEFIYKTDGEGFKLINNEGKNFFYYPLIDELYTPEEKLIKTRKLETKEAGEKLVTVYQFSSKSSSFPDEIRQLIQYTKKDNARGPDDKPWLEWKTDYSDQARQKTIFMFGKNLVRSWKDITPGQNYFDPKLFYFDSVVVVYTAMATPAENAQKLLHCLDIATAKIKWTLKLEDKYLNSVAKYDGGFLVFENRNIFLVNDEGKVINEYVKN